MHKIYQFYRRDSKLARFFSLFLILHASVHLLYAGQSQGFFELRSESNWPNEAWLISNLMSDSTLRWLANALLMLAALGFTAGSLGLFLQADWWRSVTAGSALFSSLLFFVLWNGKFRALEDQGGVGLSIDLAILIVVLIFHWPV